MKKLALVLMCTVVLLFFIGFNYLLWDRETKTEDIKNNANYIKYLDSEINRLEASNRNLTTNINQLQSQIDTGNETIDSMQKDIDDLKVQLSDKEETVRILKWQLDKALPVALIEKWINYLNEAKYTEAYNMIYGHSLKQTGAPSLRQFESIYKGKVTLITLKFTELSPNNPVSQETFTGQYEYNAVVDAVLSENVSAVNQTLEAGLNTFRFRFDFEERLKQWVITDVNIIDTVVPTEPTGTTGTAGTGEPSETSGR